MSKFDFFNLNRENIPVGLKPYTIAKNIFAIGIFEKGVTVYNQQVRALNLAYLLSNQFGAQEKKVAIIGAGVAGLTAAAALCVNNKNWKVSVFERRSDLCPLQQGNDTRWLHPHIYSWPASASTNPAAALPLMNWRAGRASDVADEILKQWESIQDKCNPSVYVETKYIKILSKTCEIEWLGYRISPKTDHLQARSGMRDTFDLIILATGFGEEVGPAEFPTISYWRNETYVQPRLDEKFQRFLISGHGDGALIDLFRLRIERFRQDRIIHDLFGRNSDAQTRLNEIFLTTKSKDIFAKLISIEKEILEPQIAILRTRLRKDTQVFLQADPKFGDCEIRDLFKGKASNMNRILLFLLLRCGGFTPIFMDLHVAVDKFGIAPSNVVCRHGTDPVGVLNALFIDYDDLSSSIRKCRGHEQKVEVTWPSGFWKSEVVS